MTKIRNCPGSGNSKIGGFAGPVRKGHRGARKSPEAFYGASTPVSIQKICKYIGGTVGALTVVAILSGCPDEPDKTPNNPPTTNGPTNPGTNPNPNPTPEPPPQPQPPTGYFEPAIPSPVGNIEFPSALSIPNQTIVNAKVREASTEIIAQSQDLQDLYANWESKLRTKSSATPEQIEFAQYVQTAQQDMQNCAKSNFRWGSDPTQGLFHKIGLLIKDTKERNLFTTKHSAFTAATWLANREYYSHGSTDQFNNATYLMHCINSINDPSLSNSSGTYAERAQILKQMLIASLPAECGPYRNGLIQQFEGRNKYLSFIGDLQSLGFQIPTTLENENEQTK